ncbi:unnamed protein product [Ceutorhynchus assimilis]|uniref:E3 ubiquitin-protein ligase RNF25 n=1 Tax=Ceutorhynchus assimilis TaxID=467358 RepID=A0A9N9MSI8_9CUCU|nr:unnamed protein product [Ceutorhynchus assimilis]
MSQQERVQEELEALEAILMDDISITYNAKGCAELVKSVIFPSTANEVDKQYVCVTLEVELPQDYPDCKPVTRLKSPRGLDESTVDHLYKEIANKCEEYIGHAVIYELIELIRQNLTESNLPTCQCAVCLYGFSEGDSFTKTQCFHYFHNYCLAKHVTVNEKNFLEEQDKLPAWKRSTVGFQATCPVCREPISCDGTKLKTSLPPKELQDAQKFEVTQELKMLQQKMQQLFNYQKSKGGIIDIEAEENKLLLITNSEDNNSEDPGPSLSSSNPPVEQQPLHNGLQNRNHNQRHYSKYSNR